MTLSRATLSVALLSIFLISCGDTFRPIAIPQNVNPPAGEAQKTAIVISSDATQSFETNVSMAGGTLTGTVVIGNGAVQAALASGRLFTANSTADTLTATLASSPQSFQPTTITLPPGSTPTFVLPVGTNVFVAFNNSGQVGVVNGTSLTYNTAIDLGGTGKRPVALVATPDGKKVYVANSGDDTVGVIDVASLSLTKTISFTSPSCDNPSWLSANPNGGLVYVVCSDSDVVHIIDTTTDSQAVSSGIPVGTQPVFSVFDPVNLRLAVANFGSSSVSFIGENAPTGATAHPVVTVPVSAQPVWITVLPDGSRSYVACKSGNITVISNIVLSVKTTIAVGGQPTHIVSSSDSLRVAATPTAGPATNNLALISTSTDTVTGSAIPIAGTSKYLLVSP